MTTSTPLLDLVEPLIEPYQRINRLEVARMDGSFVKLSFKKRSTNLESIDARVPRLDVVSSRFQLDAIVSLTLTARHTPSEVEVLLTVLPACSTSLKTLSLGIAGTHDGPQPSFFSIFELGLIPTMSALCLVYGSGECANFSFPMRHMDLREINISRTELARLEWVFTQFPLLDTLLLKVEELEQAYGFIHPIIGRHKRDIKLHLEQKDGCHATVQFHHLVDHGKEAVTIDLCVSTSRTYHLIESRL